MADRREKIILGLDVGPYVRGLATASTATKAFVKELDSSDSRMGNLVQTSLALGPALVPISAVAVPAVASLTAGLGAAAGAAGVAALAFNGIGDGLKALNDYQLEPSAKNFEALRQAFEDIGPAGAQFVQFLDNLEPRLDRMQNIARGGLLPGVQEGIENLIGRGPQVERIIANIAGAMGELVAEGGDALAGGRFDDFFDYIENEAGPILQDMGRTLGNVTEGLANMLVGFGPAGNDFSRILLGLSRDFAEWSRNLENNEGFQEFVEYVRRVTPSALETLGAVGRALADIVEAAAPIGEASLPIIRVLASTLSAIAESPAGPALVTAAAGISAISRAVALYNVANGSALLGLLGKTESKGKHVKEAGFAASAGFRAAAAGAGVLALSLTDIDDSLGVSNTAMGAAIGLLGGPWGAAIGGAIGATIDFAHANDDLEDSLKSVDTALAAGDFGGLTQARKSLSDVEGKLHDIENPDKFLGVVGPMDAWRGSVEFFTNDLHDAEDALRADIRAFGDLRQTLGEIRGYTKGGGLENLTFDIDKLGQFAEKARPALRKMGYSLEDLRHVNTESEMRRIAAGIRHFNREAESAPGRSKAMGRALKELNDPMATAEESATALATALDSVFTPALNADEAMQARIESLIALRKQLRKTNGEFDFSTQATRDSRTAIRDHVSAIAAEAKAMAERGDGTRKVSRYLREQRAAMLQAFPKEARDEAKQLIDRTFRYGEIIKGLPKTAKTKFEQPGAEKSIKDAKTLDGWVRTIPDQHKTDTSAPGIEKTIEQFGSLFGDVQRVDDKKEVKTSAPGADKAIGQFKNLDQHMRTLQDKEVALTLNANSKDVVSDITDMLANLFADGGIVEAFADGGMRENHIAQIARPGAMRIWAEPETGGEAYIPLAASKRPRSRAIADETVRRLGGEAIWNENGSITLDTRANPNPNKPARKIDRQYEEIARQFGKEMSDALNAGLANLTYGFHWPLPRRYGPSGTWGTYDSGGSHPALDWPAPLGTPIFSTLPGKVSSVQHLGDSYGNHVRISHGKGLESISAHMLQTKASVGERVSPGETIGTVDSTGNSTGNHLHLEFRKNGVPINYTSWLSGGGPMGIAGPMGVYDGDHSGLDRASPGEAKAYAKSIMGRWGWGPFQWPYWEDLGNRESGWRWDARNPSSGAYGIPQSLPPEKMASAGADWQTNAGTQLDWMAGYMSDRYGGPYGAIQWHNAHNWYRDGAILMDQGGILRHGEHAVNLSGRDEAFLDPEQTEMFLRMVNALEGFNKPPRDPGHIANEGIDFPEYLGLSDKEQTILDRAGEKFGIDAGMDRSEIRQEMNDLIGAVEQAFDGSNDGLIKTLERFKDRALDTAKALEQERAERDKLRDQLKATRQKANEFGNTVAGNFQNDPFSGGLDEFFLQTRADRNDARRGNRLRRRAERLGLDGPLAKQLLASGNLDLLAEIVAGGPSEVRKAERAFEQSRRASNRYGNNAADMIFGERLDKQTRALERETEQIQRLRMRLEHIEDRIGDRVERGARKGTKDGMDGKNKLLQQMTMERRG